MLFLITFGLETLAVWFFLNCLFSSIIFVNFELISLAGTFKSFCISLRDSIELLIKFSASFPTTASILLTPDATLDSLVIKKVPISPVLFTCVPPHNSIENLSPKSTTLTSSSYFSPNIASAPLSIASSSFIMVVIASVSCKITLFTMFCTSSISCWVRAFG